MSGWQRKFKKRLNKDEYSARLITFIQMLEQCEGGEQFCEITKDCPSELSGRVQVRSLEARQALRDVLRLINGGVNVL